ncbi:glycosyltransferase [Larsenimonas suaedae]|uniref:Glycosyltransferase n=1 Tax=Larsenimonas suaedae TaxID=1851019 RepID=A0ABU1GUC6_9GAMM|nr:glycosyltransferase [Larsenimonas suaedae]MCM2972032.1 glycosyltransferase [Larsenimonas suaedae]MDR5895584.1 glycosyltransferase [Larsenimonas suaedae]
MNILVFTNTYRPIVGGVSESVQRFVDQFQALGHKVLVIAPNIEGQPPHEDNVLRVPSFQRFNGTQFSFPMYMTGAVIDAVEAFAPDLIHAHHPFLLGDSAARLAQRLRVPLVFTHHTLYERYIHYFPSRSPAIKRFAVALASCYAELCDTVIVPSESVREILLKRDVETPIEVLPSGVYTERFAKGDKQTWRRHFGIGEQTHVVGHVGRLAKEKNLGFMTRAVCRYLSSSKEAHFLVVGDGDEAEQMAEIAHSFGVSDRVHFTGVLSDQSLVDAYHAMSTFVFASHSETQGMVVAEAMAAGLPVVALDAPGVREVVRNDVNGMLLEQEDEHVMADALMSISAPERYRALRDGALESAQQFDAAVCAERCLALYQHLIDQARTERGPKHADPTFWDSVTHRFDAEWHILRHRGAVLKEVFWSRREDPADDDEPSERSVATGK